MARRLLVDAREGMLHLVSRRATALYPHKSKKLAEDFFIILPRRNIQYNRLHYVTNSDRVLKRGKGREVSSGGRERG